MKKYSAVEWLVNCIESMQWGEIITRKELYAKAKEMEKQQIMDANTAGVNNGLYGYRNAEQYYNKTFKKK